MGEIHPNIYPVETMYSFIEYATPGKELAEKILTHNVIFLQNHGLIIPLEWELPTIKFTEAIENEAKSWLDQNTKVYGVVMESEYPPLFPDAAIFPEEMRETKNEILKLMLGAGLTPNFLPPEEIAKLNQMPDEQYRQSL